MKRLILTLALCLLCGAGVITAVPAHAQTDDPLVIKNGELTLLVADTGTAVTTALNLVTGFNGYILSQRQWEDEARYRHAEIQVGIPAASFESVLAAFRTLGTVQTEQISGQDVSDTAVDLASRLDNLHANQERVRALLEQTRFMTETLDVHDQLTRVEGELGNLQGQKNYLTDRAAHATLTLRLLPLIPTPAPTPTATPTPLPTPQAWDPGHTVRLASLRLTETGQTVFDFTLYRLIVCGPWLLVLGLLSLAALRLRHRWHRSTQNPIETAENTEKTLRPPPDL